MVDPNRKDDSRRCVFCGVHKVSREHVWPDWIGKVMQERLGESTWTIQRPGNQPRVTVAFDATVKRACKPCNEGWMSDLEGKAKPILVPMMFAESQRIPLSVEQQRILAAWVLKTALVSDFYLPEQAYWPELYSQFYAEKAPSRMQTAVWMAGHNGPTGRLRSRIGTVDLFLTSDYGRDGVLIPVPKYKREFGISCSLQLLHAVFQVIVYRGHYGPIRTRPVPGVRHLSSQIWPVKAPVVWPPFQTALTDRGLAEFFGRRFEIEFAWPSQMDGPPNESL